MPGRKPPGHVRFVGCRRQARGRWSGKSAELFDGSLCLADVSGAEQRLAPVERKLSARRVARVETRNGSSEQTRSQRHVVAAERAPSGGREPTRRALAEHRGFLIALAELAQKPVRLFEMTPDGFIVLGRVGDLRFDPLGKLGVQLRAFAL